MKKLKKFFKILLITILILFVLVIGALFAIPYFFKDEILAKVKTELNNNVNANVEFENFNLSLFTHFPSLTIELEGLSVKGKGDFADEDLLTLKSFYVDLGLRGVIKGESEVRAIVLDSPVIHAKVLENGKANWDIAPQTDEAKPKPTPAPEVPEAKPAPKKPATPKPKTNTEKREPVSKPKVEKPKAKKPPTVVFENEDEVKKSDDFKVKLEKFQIKDAQIIFDDKSSKMYASINDLNLIVKGSLSEAVNDVDIDFKISEIDFIQDGATMAKNMSFSFIAGITVDMSDSTKMVVNFRENKLSVSKLGFGFDGMVAMAGDDVDMNLTFYTKDTKFKDVLAMVPKQFMKDLAGLKTSGEFGINGFAKGNFNSVREIYPAFALNFFVNNGFIQYPDLPKSVNGINIDLKVKNRGGDLDYTLVNIDKFDFKLGESPFKSSFKASNVISNPTFSGKLDGDIDLSTMKDAVPMKNLKLLGRITTNMNFTADMKQVEAKDYENIDAKGNLKMKNFVFSYDSLPVPNDIEIPVANIDFNPKKLNLSTLKIKIGKSDFDFKGEVTQFIPFVFNKGSVKAKLNYKSKHIDASDLMAEDPKAKPEDKSVIKVDNLNIAGDFVVKPFPPADTTKPAAVEPQPVEIPENIYAKVKTNIEKIQFDSLYITKTSGNIVVDKKQARLNNLLLHMLKGSVLMNGRFSTVDKWNPDADFKLNVKDVDIQTTGKTFNSVKAMMPIVKSCHGRVSMDLNVKTKLDTAFSPVLNTVNGKGKLMSDQVNLSESKILDQVAKQIKNDKFRKIEAKNLNVSFKIVNGDIIVSPFDIKQWNSKMTISGTQSLDQTIDFDIRYDIAREDLGGEANKGLSKLAALTGGLSDALIGKRIKVDTKVVGTSTKPKVKLVFKKSKSDSKAAKKERNKKVKKAAEKELRSILKDKKKQKELEKKGKELLKKFGF